MVTSDTRARNPAFGLCPSPFPCKFTMETIPSWSIFPFVTKYLCSFIQFFVFVTFLESVFVLLFSKLPDHKVVAAVLLSVQNIALLHRYSWVVQYCNFYSSALTVKNLQVIRYIQEDPWTVVIKENKNNFHTEKCLYLNKMFCKDLRYW